MALKSELMHAILSMGSYNRGYDASINTLSSNVATKIGNAVITTTSTIKLGNGIDSAIGFYGLAYDTNNDEVADIISCRGTDYPKNDTLRDVAHGWTLGGGFTSSRQGLMAVDFCW